MPSMRSVRAILFIAFGVTLLIGLAPASTASALPTSPTTAVKHRLSTSTTTTTASKPPQIDLVPPATVVLSTPESLAAAAEPTVLSTPSIRPTTATPVASQAEALPHTL